MKEYQIYCSNFCGYVKVDFNDIIISDICAFNKFKGQPLNNLISWLSNNFGYCTLKRLK